MITIDRMTTALRITGLPAARAHLAKRLDRVVAERVGAALDAAVTDVADDDGPVYRIRRLDLSLWLDAGRLDDGEIARRWAATIARALHRRIADGGTGDVVRYPSPAAFLAAFLADLAGGRATGRWEYHEFRALADLPAGRAAAAVLGREPRWIGPVFESLDAADRLDAVIAAFTRHDVEAVWRLWADAPPRAPARIERALLARAAGIVRDPPAAETGGEDARARTALRWLVALATGRGGLPATVAAGLALQLAHLGALVAAVPNLRERLAAGLAPEPSAGGGVDGTAAADWLEAALAERDGAARLRDLLALAEPRGRSTTGARKAPLRSERIVSPFAGLALLLPAIRALELPATLGPHGLLLLLVAAVPRRQRPLATGDLALRWLSGVPRDVPLEALRPPRWPPGAAPDPRDAATHGTAPEMATLRQVLDRFATGLRGMEGSSAGYLAEQFLCRAGTLERDAATLRVTLSAVPLRVLLRMGGRLGPQGPLGWLEDRELVVEAADG